MDIRFKIVEEKVYGAFTFCLADNGILWIHVTSDDYDIEELKKGINVIGEMASGQAVPLLITHDPNVIPPVETRSYWALKDSCPYSKCEAFMVNSVAQKLIGNFYLSFNKPGRPTRLFTNEEDAIKWLMEFKP